MKKIHALLIAVALMVSFCAGAVASGNLEEIKALLNYGITIKYDGVAQEMYDEQGQRVYPITYNGTTYLPVRAVSNMLNIGVAWDGENNTVLLGKDAVAVNISRGLMTENNYQNESVGIGFEVPENWMFASAEIIDQILGQGASAMGVSDISKIDAFCDVLAVDNEKGTNINVLIERKKALAMNADFNVLYDEVIKSISTEILVLYDSANVEKTTVKVGDKDFLGYNIIGTYQEADLYQRGFMVDLGDYVATVTVSGATEADVAAAVGYLYLVG